MKGARRMFNEYNDVMSVDDVAAILQVGFNTVYRLLNEKELKGFRIGHTWRIPKQCLIDYVLKDC